MIGWGDYADGIAARVTGQYSRLGALMDPVTDRLLVISGVVVCWHFELLPRWALAVLAARELLMLALGRYGLSARRRAAHQLARPARGRAGDGRVLLRDGRPARRSAEVLLYVGLALALAGDRAVRARGPRAAARRHRARPSLKLSLTFWAILGAPAGRAATFLMAHGPAQVAREEKSPRWTTRFPTLAR